MPCGLIVFNCHVLVVIVILVELTWSRPIFNHIDQRELTGSSNKTINKDRRHSIFDDKNRAVLGELHTYLSNYGYLPRSDLETRAMRTQDEFRSAIRRLQTFASIPVTGALDAATLNLIRRPRCGLADFEPNRLPRPHTYGNRRRRRYVLQGQKWAKTHLSYKIMNYTPDMSHETIERAIYHALLIWSYPSQLRFRQANELEHPDIEFLFAQGYHKDGYQFDGKGSVLAHAFYPEEQLGGDVHYDEDEDWSAYRENEYGFMDLFSVTVHELGHSLGLMHSNIPDAIMFPYYRGYSTHMKLHSDDIAAIRKLYGDPSTGVSVTLELNSVETTATTAENNSHTTTESMTTHTIEATTIATTTTTTTIITTTTTLIPTIFTTEIITSTNPTTMLALINQFSAENKTIKTTMNHSYRTRHRHTTNSPTSKSTNNWLPPYHRNKYKQVQKVHINYTDRSKLDICDGYYDAITMYRGILFIFKDQYFWQYDRRGLDPSSPMINNAFWLGLPETLTKIDAAYERADGRLMLFSGRQYWIFEDNKISIETDGSTYPRNISSLGLPADIDHIDAAFLWSFNRQAYLVSSNLYWALDERWNRVNTYDYPRDMSMWQGIDVPLDDAFVDLTGSTYFFKGLDFWRLNDTSMESAIDYPRSINTEWLFCDKPRTLSSLTSSSMPSVQSIFICVLLLLITFDCSSL